MAQLQAKIAEGIAELKNRVISQAYESPASLNSKTLTLGCEFEFVLAHYRKPQDASKFSIYDHGLDVVRTTLASGEHNARCSDPECCKLFKFQLDVGMSDGSDYSVWQVGRDGTCNPDSDTLKPLDAAKQQYFSFYPMEVKSRILQFDELQCRAQQAKHKHWISYEQEISLVIEILDRNFGLARKHTMESEYHVLLTNNCSFHVHIGNGIEDGVNVPIPFNTTKNLFAAFIACERQIDRLHAKHRISATTILNEPSSLPIFHIDQNIYQIGSATNKPLSYYLTSRAYARRRLTEVPEDEKEPEDIKYDRKRHEEMYPQTKIKQDEAIAKAADAYDVRSWLTLALAASDILHLRQLAGLRDKSCTLNLSQQPIRTGSHASDPIRKRSTIEFRQHSATLLPIAALSYIDFCAKMVLYCHTMGREAFDDLVAADFTTISLCKRIGCSQTTTDFYKARIDSDNDPVIKQLNVAETTMNEAKFQLTIADLAQDLIKKQRDSYDRGEVSKRINEKLLMGGYGQFPENELKHLLPANTHPQERQRLLLGYEPGNGGPPDLMSDRPWGTVDPNRPTQAQGYDMMRIHSLQYSVTERPPKKQRTAKPQAASDPGPAQQQPPSGKVAIPPLEVDRPSANPAGPEPTTNAVGYDRKYRHATAARINATGTPAKRKCNRCRKRGLQCMLVAKLKKSDTLGKATHGYVCGECRKISHKCEDAEIDDDPGPTGDGPPQKFPRRRSPGDDDDENSGGGYGLGGNVQGDTTYQPPTIAAA